MRTTLENWGLTSDALLAQSASGNVLHAEDLLDRRLACRHPCGVDAPVTSPRLVAVAASARTEADLRGGDWLRNNKGGAPVEERRPCQWRMGVIAGPL